MGGDAEKYNLTIASGGTTTDALHLPATFFPAGVVMPAIDTSTAITFLVSLDGITYVPLHNGLGSLYSVTISNSAANAITLDPTKFYPWEYVKVKVADAQTGAKTIIMVVRNY